MSNVPLLTDLQGPWAGLRLELVGPGASASPVALPDIYPFQSITEFKRRIWMHHNGDPRWAPVHVFLGVRDHTDPTQIRPLEFHWKTKSLLTLPDPTSGAPVVPSPLLVDDAGARRPLQPTMIGSLLLEATGIQPTDTIVAINLALLASGQTTRTLTPAIFGGYFQLYFPWLTSPGQVLDSTATAGTTQLRKEYAATVPYLEDRTGRVSLVQRAMARGASGPNAIMRTMVRIRWFLPLPASRPDSLEKTFYGIKASAVLPFLRYFPRSGTGGSPVLKLGLNPDGSPIISNPKILAAYLSQVAPNTDSSVIMARIPLNSPQADPAAAFTLYMMEDGTSDITFEVPQRGAVYLASVAEDAERRLREIIPLLNYPATLEPELKELFATYSWVHPSPKSTGTLTTERLRRRAAALPTFFAPAELNSDEAGLIALQWKAVSNYESEGAQFDFITQMFRRAEKSGLPGKTQRESHAAYIKEISTQFGILEEQAETLLGKWMERRAEAVAPAPGAAAGGKAVPAHAIGARIVIAGSHPEYTIEVQGASSYTELQRILSVVGTLLGATPADLALEPPPKLIAGLEPIIEKRDAAIAVAGATGGGSAAAATAVPEEEEDTEDVAEEDLEQGAAFDDFMESLLGVGGVNSNNASEIVEEAEVAAPLPEPESIPALPAPVLAALPENTAVEEECRGNPWGTDEPALKIKPEWYMARLKGEDPIMFGYKATGQSKSYSKSCQRRDDRQPNLMTQAEYNRVVRCYESKVRFVNLPPRSPADLPNDPTYNPRRSYKEEYYLTDPETKKPMWTVYNYENKTKPGKYVYLMCAELWCDRDNLPLLRSEFEGTAGRGFVKEPNTCPFCGGRPIADFKAPAPLESVIVRYPKAATGKIHSFIGTITRNKHPAGYSLPCCDTTPRLLKTYMIANALGKIRWGEDINDSADDATSVVTSVSATTAAAVPIPVDEVSLEAALAAPAPPIVSDEIQTNYNKSLSEIRTQYILASEKYLGPGQFGLLPPVLDTFFGQNGPTSLTTLGIRTTFKRGSVLFVRMGVDIHPRATGLNLFAALAPYLNLESAEQVQRMMLASRTVRAFESANYGTLLHEFAARPIAPATRFDRIEEFAAEFGYPLEPDTARQHVKRLYRAWTSYQAYLNDSMAPKQLRHIEHLLAQPGIFSEKGLLLLVLERDGDQIKIACPSFGIPPSFKYNFIGIILHNKRENTWEPLVLYNDNGEQPILKFDMYSISSIPVEFQIPLEQWIRKWRSATKGCGRDVPPPHVWSPPTMDSTGLPRFSDMTSNPQLTVTTLVRDRSNRLVGVLARRKRDATQLPIYVPCLDDGHLGENVPRIYEAGMIPLSSLDATIRFYLDPAIAGYTALTPTRIISKLLATGEMILVGIRTAVGTIVPIKETIYNPASLASPLPIEQIAEFPWEIDDKVIRLPDPEAPMATVSMIEKTTAPIEGQLNEAYQYLRLSFGRFLGRDARGGEVLTAIRDLIAQQTRLPLFEIRKRMDIFLEPFVREMVSAEVVDPTHRRSLSLLRQDCLSLPEDKCNTTGGACSWDSGRGRCLIHAPKIAASPADPISIFTARLSDELLRYANLRNQLLTNAVPEIRQLSGIAPVRIENELYMKTRTKESGSSILSRLGIVGGMDMTYPEEMLRMDEAEDAANELNVRYATAGGVPVIKDYIDNALPEEWMRFGFVLPTPSPELENPRNMALTAVSGFTPQQIGTSLISTGVPFTWKPDELEKLATRTKSNIVFIANGRIQSMIRPATITNQFIIFWGPQQLLIGKRNPIKPAKLSWIVEREALPPSFSYAYDIAIFNERQAAAL